MKIFGFHDGQAPAYYRILLPLDAMHGFGGHEIDTSCGWQERCTEFPVIVSQRLSQVEALPMWRRLAVNHRLFYEIDDDVWSIDEYNLGARISHTDAHIDAVEQALMISHAAIVSTDVLAERIKKFNRNVTVLQNHIDGKLLQMQRPKREKLVIGWAGGGSHYRDLLMIAPELKRVLKGNPGVELHTIGTDFRDRGLKGRFQYPLPATSRHTPWSDDIWGYYSTIDFDIGLAPLANTTFNESKSHIKALEYMALGIPVIVSDMPPYNSLVKHGVNGWLVRQPHEWRKRIRELINDEQMREEMGANGKQTAARWTIQEGWRGWERAYRLAGSKEAA